MNGAEYDPRTALTAGVSIKPGTELSGTTAAEGDWIDLGDASVTPIVNAACMTGSATGSPSSYSVTFKLREADSSGGSGAQDCTIKTDAVHTADKKHSFATGRRTKRYVQVVATPAFTGGAGPKVHVSASVLATAYKAG